ncbi:hypothetical protein SCYAM73S_01951 [Streptomyces cyaneofuscatus]
MPARVVEAPPTPRTTPSCAAADAAGAADRAAQVGDDEPVLAAGPAVRPTSTVAAHLVVARAVSQPLSRHGVDGQHVRHARARQRAAGAGTAGRAVPAGVSPRVARSAGTVSLRASAAYAGAPSSSSSPSAVKEAPSRASRSRAATSGRSVEGRGAGEAGVTHHPHCVPAVHADARARARPRGRRAAQPPAQPCGGRRRSPTPRPTCSSPASAIALPTSPSSRVFSASLPLLPSLFSSVAMSLRPSANLAWSLVSSVVDLLAAGRRTTRRCVFSSVTASFCFFSPSSTSGGPAFCDGGPDRLVGVGHVLERLRVGLLDLGRRAVVRGLLLDRRVGRLDLLGLRLDARRRPPWPRSPASRCRRRRCIPTAPVPVPHRRTVRPRASCSPDWSLPWLSAPEHTRQMARHPHDRTSVKTVL